MPSAPIPRSRVGGGQAEIFILSQIIVYGGIGASGT
jgi:hypothetical protein